MSATYFTIGVYVASSFIYVAPFQVYIRSIFCSYVIIQLRIAGELRITYYYYLSKYIWESSFRLSKYIATEGLL